MIGSEVSSFVCHVCGVISCCIPCTNSSLVIADPPGAVLVIFTSPNMSRLNPASILAGSVASIKFRVIESMRIVAFSRDPRIMLAWLNASSSVCTRIPSRFPEWMKKVSMLLVD